MTSNRPTPALTVRRTSTAEDHGRCQCRLGPAINFYQYLSESVSVIWYQALPEIDSITLFTRLNIGRIPLTDAELVKVLVLARSREARREREIAAQWDAIESDLRTEELWAFVTGRTTSEPTHITLLLDTLAGTPASGPRPLFHTFETLRPQIEQDAQALWDRVVDLHSLVLGWLRATRPVPQDRICDRPEPPFHQPGGPVGELRQA